jgi:hypothetical protein
MIVPHWTWASAVDWRATPRPVVRLALRVSVEGAAGKRRRWRPLLTGRLDFGGRR